jgi:signal transduction histidine kinase
VAASLSLLLQGLLSLPFAGGLSVGAYLLSLLPMYVLIAVLFGLLAAPARARLARFEQSRGSRQPAASDEIERRRAIYKLFSTLSSSLNYQWVLETALDLTAEALGDRNGKPNRMVSAVFLFNTNDSGGTDLRVGSARRFTPADLRIALDGATGLLGETIDSGQPHLSNEIAADPELSRIIALRACKSAYCIPLRAGLDTHGVLLFAHPQSGYFTQERRDVLDIIGNQAMIAIQNARLYRDLEQEKERMMEIQEEARNKLARDLHDGPTQSIAAIAMRVNFARRLIDRDPKAAGDELYKVEDLARRTTKEIRHMLFTLRPLVLESQGLVPALESMADKMKEIYNQEVLIDADADIVKQLELTRQGVVFYIAEEAVNNARKHANAQHIWVRLKPAEEEIALLVIEDDGVGFDLDRVGANYENRGSLGMVNMRERTELVNGLLQIDSKPGSGTHVSVFIPLSERAIERVRRGQ